MERLALQRPVLERESDARSVRLGFAAFSVSGLWVSEFMRQEHEHKWPADLPKPYYEHGEIRVKSLPPEDVGRFIESLRGLVDATNAEVARLRMDGGVRLETAEPRLQFEAQVAAAERVLDDLFSADSQATPRP